MPLTRPGASMAQAAQRLNALSPLDAEAVAALKSAGERARVAHPPQELLSEGKPVSEVALLLDGWAARVRHLADGRRAILNFVLPGDLIGLCDQRHPLATSTVVAMTRVVVCAAPDRNASPSLARAYAVSRAVEEAHLLNQITRLSRLTAYERMADLVLELLERLELAGLATRGSFTFPATQETISDVLGLSTVHVNRILQQARKSGDLSWTGRNVQVCDPDALRQAIGRQRVRVTASMRASGAPILVPPGAPSQRPQAPP